MSGSTTMYIFACTHCDSIYTSKMDLLTHKFGAHEDFIRRGEGEANGENQLRVSVASASIKRIRDLSSNSQQQLLVLPASQSQSPSASSTGTGPRKTTTLPMTEHSEFEYFASGCGGRKKGANLPKKTGSDDSDDMETLISSLINDPGEASGRSGAGRTGLNSDLPPPGDDFVEDLLTIERAVVGHSEQLEILEECHWTQDKCNRSMAQTLKHQTKLIEQLQDQQEKCASKVSLEMLMLRMGNLEASAMEGLIQRGKKRKAQVAPSTGTWTGTGWRTDASAINRNGVTTTEVPGAPTVVTRATTRSQSRSSKAAAISSKKARISRSGTAIVINADE